MFRPNKFLLRGFSNQLRDDLINLSKVNHTTATKNYISRLLETMPETEFFAGYTFILIPSLTTKVAMFRKNLYKKNGALIKYTLTNIDDSMKNCIIIEDSGPKIDKALIMKSLRLKNVQDGDNFISKYPILDKEWVTNSLLKGKIEDYLKYMYPIEGISYDKDSKIIFGIDQNARKRKHEFEETENASKNMKIDDSSDTESIVEEEHAVSKKLLSSERLLLFLNSDKSDPENPNQLVVEYFSNMADEYKKNGESFKYVNYRKAISTIQGLDHKLTSYDEAISLPNIGKRLAEKIEQINKTGKLTQLDALKKDPKLQTLQLFTGVYGVGQTVAQRWYEQGLRTLDDVASLPTLTENQKLGIKFYKDWNTKIPRDEVENHIDYISDTLASIDDKLELVCAGSYRRGLRECGDVDFMLFKKDCNDTSELSQLLHQLVLDLTSQNYIKCSLMGVSPKMRKFFGGGQLPEHELCRRIDFLVVPWVRRGAALVYFTGNDILNRSMRHLASGKGLHLNEKGLFEKFNTKDQRLLESFDERLIFEKLGIAYREPKDRNLGNFNELNPTD